MGRARQEEVLSQKTPDILPTPVRVTVIIPTYQEAENLPELFRRLAAVRERSLPAMDALVMDDDSGDGTPDVVAGLALPWVRLVTRKENRGLSPAVVDGFRLAGGEIIAVMDADLSHPPESLSDLVAAILAGADFAIGSRYVPGAGTAENWGWFRWLNSRVATLLARPFTSVSDPMSGFFAFPRRILETGAPLNPIGYKIGLEVLVKCRCERVVEVPIFFDQRHKGQSKLSFREQWRYLLHLRRLAMFKYDHLAHFLHFGLVGFLGTGVNLAVLTLLDWAGLPIRLSVALAILTAMVFNYFLNRWITFTEGPKGAIPRQLAAFIAACSVGAVVNYGVTLSVIAAWPFAARFPQVASVLGILAGLVFNYLASRFWVFRYRKGPVPSGTPRSGVPGPPR
ncbi:MAG TPA: glycosyltransferase family 2 protein [Candidatus Hydrogenedentes bacterium]|nr:glycosyltransferase family 2 protein [Candidatus Hydrogenedentota bacterium]